MMDKLEVINRGRKKVRKWITLALSPLLIASVLFGAHGLLISYLSSSTISLYNTGKLDEAQQAAQWLKVLSLYEDWKANYNYGTILLKLGVYDEAIEELELALGKLKTVVPSPDNPLGESVSGLEEFWALGPTDGEIVVCDVVQNLALSYEGRGDERKTDKRFEDAQEDYDHALGLINVWSEICSSSSASESMSETQQRLGGKGNQPQEPEEPEPDEEQQQEIKDQLDQNTQQREEDESTDPNNNLGDFGSGERQSSDPVDKPW